MANPCGTQSPAPPAWAVGACGALALAVAMGIGRFAFTPMLPLMIREGQLDVAAGGWLAAANYAGYLAGAMTAARVPGGAVRLGVAALWLTALLTAAMAIPLPLVAAALLRFAAGVASAWVFVSTAVWSLGALARAGRAGWGGWVYAGVGAGIAVAGLYCLAGGVAGLAASALWLQLGALAVVMMLPVLWLLRRLHADPPQASASKGTAAPPGTTGLVICYAALGFGYILPATFLPVLAREVVQDPRLFGLVWPVFGATAAMSTVMAGAVMRHASRVQVWSVSQALMALGVLLPSFWPNGATIALSALLVGGTFMVITMAGVQEIRARASGDPARWVARMTTAFALGQIAGPVASSALLHAAGERHGLSLALQAAALALIASAAWLWRESRLSSSTIEVSHVS